MLRRVIFAVGALFAVVSTFPGSEVRAQEPEGELSPQPEEAPAGSPDEGAPTPDSGAASSEPAEPSANPELGEPGVAAASAPVPSSRAGTPVAAGAQSADAEEVVVTAQRYRQGLQEAPVAVTAYSPKTMDQRGITNLQDADKFTPNLQLHSTNRPAGGGSAYAAYIRGIGTGDFQFPTDPGVGLYVDDVYIARTMGGLLSIDSDIERIEIIKGPQGTLFGRNTIGGAINIVTFKPETTGEAGGAAVMRIGDYGRRDFGVGVNAPIIDGKMGAKLSIASVHADGYGQRLLTSEKAGNEDRFVARGGLRFTPLDDLDITLNGDYSRQDQRPPNGVFLRFVPAGPTVAKIDKYNMFAAPALNPGLGLAPGSIYDAHWVSPNAYDNYGLQPVFDRYDIGGGSGVVSYGPSELFKIKSITAVRALGSHISVDGDQTPYPLQTSNTKLDQKQYSEEIQLSGGAWQERIRYLLGFYAFRETGSSRVNTQSFHGLFENEPMPIPPDAGDTSTLFDLTATTYAVFTQETVEFVPRAHVTVGARINRDIKDYSYLVDFTQTGMAQVPLSHASATWDSFTPKVGLDWRPVDPLMVYASYANGFKSGGFGPSNNAMVPTPKYDPEKVTAYELGVKTDWLPRHRLTLNVAGFYNDYRDIQLTVQRVDPVTNANIRTTQNAGGSHIKGFEVEVGAIPVHALALNLGVGYVDARFSSLSAAATTGPPGAPVFHLGDNLPQIPTWSVNGGAQYAFEMDPGELTLRGDIIYKSEQFLTAVDPTSRQEGYFLYNARISFIPAGAKSLELSIYGLNLADKVYYIYHATLPPTGQEVAIPAAPRTIYAQARYLL